MKLTDELQRLELENGEKQAQLDRALREKRSVEAELEKVYHEGMLESGHESRDVMGLSERACTAERLRDEAQMKADSLANQLRRTEALNRQETSRLEGELETLRDRYLSASDALVGTNEDRVHLTEQVDELRQQLQKMNDAKNAAQRAAMKQMSSLQQELQVKEKQYEVKLQALEDSHRQSTLELRNMLAAQQHMSTKWKEECGSIAQKMEHNMNDSRNELARERRRNEELTRLLRESRDKTVEAEAKIQQYSRNIREMENKILGPEHQTSQFSRSVHNASARSKGLSVVEARRLQQHELEHSLKQSLAVLS